MTREEMYFEALKLLAQFILAAAVSWLAVKLAISRYKSEKSWERQIDAYVGIIKALTELSMLKSKIVANHYSDREQSDQEKAEFDARYEQNRLLLIEYIAIAKISLPKEVSEKFSSIYKEMESYREYEDYYLDTENDLKIIEKHIAFMTENAQKAIGARESRAKS